MPVSCFLLELAQGWKQSPPGHVCQSDWRDLRQPIRGGHEIIRLAVLLCILGMLRSLTEPEHDQATETFQINATRADIAAQPAVDQATTMLPKLTKPARSAEQGYAIPCRVQGKGTTRVRVRVPFFVPWYPHTYPWADIPFLGNGTTGKEGGAIFFFIASFQRAGYGRCVYM